MKYIDIFYNLREELMLQLDRPDVNELKYLYSNVHPEMRVDRLSEDWAREFLELALQEPFISQLARFNKNTEHSPIF